MRIAVVAPSCTLKREAAERVQAIVAERGDCELADPSAMLPVRRPFRRARRSAARGAARGHGRCFGRRAVVRARRLWIEPDRRSRARTSLPEAARGKTYMGYSDAGFLLAGLHKLGISAAWGPMPQDVHRVRAEKRRSIVRSTGSCAAIPPPLEPDLKPPAMAFNLTVSRTCSERRSSPTSAAST